MEWHEHSLLSDLAIRACFLGRVSWAKSLGRCASITRLEPPFYFVGANVAIRHPTLPCVHHTLQRSLVGMTLCGTAPCMCTPITANLIVHARNCILLPLVFSFPLTRIAILCRASFLLQFGFIFCSLPFGIPGPIAAFDCEATTCHHLATP